MQKLNIYFADFEQVKKNVGYFVDFGQVSSQFTDTKMLSVILLTLNLYCYYYYEPSKISKYYQNDWRQKNKNKLKKILN